MAGLTDMEELLSKVPEKEIRDYLREAMVCYGAGAYRGCVVLVHTALFDGFRRRLFALAPVNSAAKAVSDAIEPLASSQKVFELQLIQRMKAGNIIDQLESDILEDLNNKRNKAAHPSGHQVMAEEARYVFSEAVQKFLSKPVRQTSVLVKSIIDRLAGSNFFVGSNLSDIRLIVEQEVENLDEAAYPQLIVKLIKLIEGQDKVSAENARKFLVALARKRDVNIRSIIKSKFFDQKSDNNLFSQLSSELVTSDPQLLEDLKDGTRVRVQSLLLRNAQATGVAAPYSELRNPAQLLDVAISVLGEQFMTTNYKEFVDWVIEQAPQAPKFASALANAPTLLERLLTGYRLRAASSQWHISNPFAEGAPALDGPLSAIVSDAQAFQLIAAVVKGAQWNGFEPMALANEKFAVMPNIKTKAVSYAVTYPEEAQAILAEIGIDGSLVDFQNNYF